MIQIESARAPFTLPRIAFQAFTALGRADAMGLLPADKHIEILDLSSFGNAIRHIHRAGIARNIQVDFTHGSVPNLERTLEQLNLALEESPAPEFEWNRLAEVLGVELLGRLVGISVTSVRRYRANARATPDDVAERLHFLSLVVGDLAGAYNEIGVRQWFERKRAQLDGRTPLDSLKGRWKPAQPGPRRVQDLARALVASPASATGNIGGRSFRTRLFGERPPASPDSGRQSKLVHSRSACATSCLRTQPGSAVLRC
jgi:hypothetical protein